MTNFFYFDRSNQKQGPVSAEQLKELATRGVIEPNTPMETDTGHKGRAGQIPGLFAAGATPFAQPVQTAPAPAPRQLFCTNCGVPGAEYAITCMSCGAKPVGYKNFCRQCGTALHPGQLICVKCGVAVQSIAAAVGSSSCSKNRVTAALLALFLGGFGAHKFYMGSWGWGILYPAFVFLIIPFFSGFFGALIFGADEDIIGGLIFMGWFSLGIVCLIEFGRYLALSDEAFAEKYPDATKAPFRW